MKIAIKSFVSGATTVKRGQVMADDDPRVALLPDAFRDAESTVEQATARPGEQRTAKPRKKAAAKAD